MTKKEDMRSGVIKGMVEAGWIVGTEPDADEYTDKGSHIFSFELIHPKRMITCEIQIDFQPDKDDLKRSFENAGLDWPGGKDEDDE